MNDKIHRIAALSTQTILSILKTMDEIKVKSLLLFDENHSFTGMVTIGDIQRAIIRNVPMSSLVSEIMDKNKVYASVHESKESISRKMRRMRAECMPVIGESGHLVDVVFWKDLFKGEDEPLRQSIDLPVVIMAGGKGTRLRPLTNVIPKPLIPVGSKTILEEIMDQFQNIGCRKFYMSVNYKYDMLKFYLNQLECKYDIEFFQEERPLGTIGSVSLLKEKIRSPFFVSNCDILINQDYRDVYEYHVQNKNELTIVSAVKSFTIPYGVVEAGADGVLEDLKEKPESTYMINTGVYILNPELIAEIPENEFFHVTHLMEKIRLRGGRIGCFPVSENSWTDIGEWSEYLKLISID